MASLSIIMLAGSIRPSPLRAELGEPALRMPLRADYSLLDAWLDALRGVDADAEMRIVVTDLTDIDVINSLLTRSRARAAGRTIGVIREQTAWRGTAGLVRDLVENERPDSTIAVLEAGCLPVVQLADALAAVTSDRSGVIVAGREREPAGVYVLRRGALDGVSPVGYSDMKEQLIPALHQSGLKIALVERDQSVLRIGDRRTYLRAVAQCGLSSASAQGAAHAARMLGACVVEQGAQIMPGVVIHDSVILRGARIGRDAVVSRSVIGSGAVVEDGERIIERIVAPDRPMSRREQAESIEAAH
jgi:hypothetical protein